MNSGTNLIWVVIKETNNINFIWAPLKLFFVVRKNIKITRKGSRVWVKIATTSATVDESGIPLHLSQGDPLFTAC